MKTILLKFAGPLQSWGTDSKFETRHTDRFPSKSGVIGILSAAFGFKRDDDANIQKFNQLDYAVRIDQEGELLKDYHIAQKHNKKGAFDRSYVTNRYYLQDAVFTVALGHEDEEWMASIEKALRYPYFQPFLGRRSNPLTADFFIANNDSDVMTNIENLKWQASPWYKRKYKVDKLTIYADANLIEHGSISMVRDRVLSFSQRERKHGFRPIRRKCVPVIDDIAVEDHNAFDSF